MLISADAQVTPKGYVAENTEAKNRRISFHSTLSYFVNNRPCHGFRRHLDEQADALEITVFV